jgi:hypothetical protein
MTLITEALVAAPNHITISYRNAFVWKHCTRFRDENDRSVGEEQRTASYQHIMQMLRLPLSLPGEFAGVL